MWSIPITLISGKFIALNNKTFKPINKTPTWIILKRQMKLKECRRKEIIKRNSEIYKTENRC